MRNVSPKIAIMKIRSISTSLIVVAAAIVSLYAVFWSEDRRIPSRLTIGVLPDQSSKELRSKYKPLVAYLEKETGLGVTLSIPQDYQHLQDLFARREIDLAYFGGLTFLRAKHQIGAIPLVMRGLDTRFTSYFVVSSSGPYGDCQTPACPKLKHGTFSFGSRLSTSGHLMPRHFLDQEWGKSPDRDFAEVVYSGSHDQTVFNVRDGLAAVGAVNAHIFRTMLADGRVAGDDLKVIWETPPYSDYVWALQNDIDQPTIDRVRNAFLRLSHANNQHSLVLEKLQARMFLPASTFEFEWLERIAVALGMIKDEQ